MSPKLGKRDTMAEFGDAYGFEFVYGTADIQRIILVRDFIARSILIIHKNMERKFNVNGRV